MEMCPATRLRACLLPRFAEQITINLPFQPWNLAASLFQSLPICSEAPLHAPHSRTHTGSPWAQHSAYWGCSVGACPSFVSRWSGKQSPRFPAGWEKTSYKRGKRWFTFHVANWTEIKVRPLVPHVSICIQSTGLLWAAETVDLGSCPCWFSCSRE